MSAARRRTPQAEAHAQSQRGRILDAAEKCFIEHGFHAASMATIAGTAGMSAGLLYRYFESKNAIVLAIIARELENKRARIEDLDLGTHFLDGVLDWFRMWQVGAPEVMNAALFLEMSAEGTRDPEIARAIRCSDTLTRDDFAKWLCRGREEGGVGMASDAARSGAILMQCLIEGLVVRAVRDPGLDRATLAGVLEPLFRHLGFSPSGPRPAA